LKLFDRAFVKGQTRPTALEWQEELDRLISKLKRCKKNPNHVYFTNKGCGLCVAEEKLKIKLKAVQENSAQPKRIRGFEVNELSRESLEKDKQECLLKEKKAREITYFLIGFYSLLMTFLPRIAVSFKVELKSVGVSVQLIVYILFFRMLHWFLKKYKRSLVKRLGVTLIYALITYTYCCVGVALLEVNDVEWSRLFKPF
jgi:uncharacterized membrane protein YhaH (DUF805 family)